MVDVYPGSILIADPFLKDPNFLRTVVFMTGHEEDGSIGFVINKPHNTTVGKIITDLEGCDFPVYYGGPVQTDSLHFLHTCPSIISDGIEITDGIFWGGNFEQVMIGIRNKIIKNNQVRFYIGYSGWSEGQLADELKEKSWLTTGGNKKLVFHNNTNLIWQDALKQMGGKYAQLVNYPIDPQLN